ncbi:hypothetical protein F5887DRAFT_985741 [Amanita rubescens]|nr:hypothetical protein F5887DRAFT_985741 [Amanita rubescens]
MNSRRPVACCWQSWVVLTSLVGYERSLTGGLSGHDNLGEFTVTCGCGRAEQRVVTQGVVAVVPDLHRLTLRAIHLSSSVRSLHIEKAGWVAPPSKRLVWSFCSYFPDPRSDTQQPQNTTSQP